MTKEEERLRYWLALSTVPASVNKILHWLSRVDDLELLFSVPAEQLKHIGIPISVGEYLNEPPWTKILSYLEWMSKANNHYIISYDDPRYPKLLKEIADPPLVLYVKGNLALLETPQLAVVGSRNPTPSGRELARLFAHDLSNFGVTVTSGLALGIDASAHRGALASDDPKTIAVMGTGLDLIYPASHKDLATEILAKNGTLVSEFAPGTEAQAYHFPKRNRIISGLSLGTLVVEAALHSGSLITARCAMEQSREVFAIPSSINNPLAKGCHSLLRQGAKLVETLEDILEELQLTHMEETVTVSHTDPETAAHFDSFITEDETYQKLLKNLDMTSTPVDVLSQRTNLPPSEISSMLLVLELNGYVESAPSGYVKKQAISLS